MHVYVLRRAVRPVLQQESTEEVPAQDAIVNSVYLNRGNIQHYVRNSSIEH